MDGCVLLTSTPSCVVSPRGETTHSGVDVNNTHRPMINPLSNTPLAKVIAWLNFGGILLETSFWPRKNLLCWPYLRNALQWHHNGCDGVSNHQPHDCLLNRSFRHTLKKTSKLRVTGLCAWNSLVTGEFPAQMASNVQNVFIWWRHHGLTRWMWNKKEVHGLDTGSTIWPLPSIIWPWPWLSPRTLTLFFKLTITMTFVWPWWGGWMYRIVTGWLKMLACHWHI